MRRGLDGFSCFSPGIVRFSSSTGAVSYHFGGEIARGKHLFPFRTEPLSLTAPMVLGGQPPGRVGRRRFFLQAAPRAAFLFPPGGGSVFACRITSVLTSCPRLFRMGSEIPPVRELLEARAGDEMALNDRHLNPQMGRILRALGFDRRWTRGEGAYLVDEAGDRYLDLLSG